MRHVSATLVSCVVLSCVGPSLARASCAEDLTRIQIALQKAPPDVQSRVGPLVKDAESKVRAKDAAGCEAATSQALELLQLPVLAPLELSTPMAHAEAPVDIKKSVASARSALKVVAQIGRLGREPSALVDVSLESPSAGTSK